jgi:asparagine synthase (glutamine-hydrolysing)
MSAIFGMIWNDGEPDAAKVARMKEAMAHRATDGSGYRQSAGCFLGYHKLCVHSRQQGEALLAEDERYVVVADARIDNRDELKGLILNGVLSDATLLLAAYRQWGKACTSRIDGEFAFAVFDKETKEFFAATDHIGFRPLYYHQCGGMFVVCSEMKGILAVKGTPNEFNDETLIEYFFRQSDQTHTYTKDIQALTGGHSLTVKDGNITVEEYWRLAPPGRYHFGKDDEWAECLRHLLIQAVERQMDTDMPVGITLSGGLDSTSIASIAGKILERRNKPLYSFSSVLPNGHSGVEQDERQYIAIAARHIPNLIPTYVDAAGISPFNKLEEAFEMEECIPNVFSYMDRALHEAARDKGVRVFLSGMGGDFLVSHKAFFVLHEMIRKGKWVAATRLLMQARRYESSYLALIKTDHIAFTKWYQRYERSRDKREINWQYYTPLQQTLLDRYPITGYERRSGKDELMRYQNSGAISRLTGSYANRYAAYGAQMAMPMLDRHVLEFMLDVPDEQYRLGGQRRSLIRRAMKGILPEEIRLRQDKQPYSPDYNLRLQKEAGYIAGILDQNKNHEYLSKYIDLTILRKYMPDETGLVSLPGLRNASSLRIGQGIYALFFLKWVYNRKYHL